MRITKGHIIFISKVILVAAIVGGIYNMLVVQKNLGELIEEMPISYSTLNYFYLVVAILLVFPNWLLESYKWKCGMDSYEKICYKDCVVSVMSGVAIGIITPARLGEYAGRLLVIGKQRYVQSFISTFLCSMSQLLVTMVIGGVTFMMTFKYFEFEGFSYDLIVYIGIFVFVILFLAYLNLAKVIELLSKNRWLALKLESLLGMESNLSLQIKLLLLAVCRYLVYTLQYILVLRFCGVEVGYWTLFSHISMIFFLQSLMPLPPVASLFARTGVALIVLSSLNINELVNVMSSMVLWIINLTLPALVGLYFILNRNSENT